MEELRYIHPTNFRTYNSQIVFFDTQFPLRLNQLAGIVKRGQIYNYNETKALIENCPIIGVHDSKFGKLAKEHFGIRRFKLLEPMHTDKEIQSKGKEILTFQTKEGQSYGIVTGYQKISRYEVIDFDKPARSMQVGMMPAKLTHIMINIGLTYTSMDTTSNIYDPFCGLGTTVLMANALGYHAIGSDIQPEHAEKNIDRRKSRKNNESPAANMYIFKHDVTKPFTEPKLQNVDLIVSEGWLGPVVTQKTTPTQVEDYAQQVTEIYQKFLHNIQKLKPQLPTIVLTVPYYIGHENTIATTITEQAHKLGRETKIIKEIYSRPKQHVGRQICIFTTPQA